MREPGCRWGYILVVRQLPRLDGLRMAILEYTSPRCRVCEMTPQSCPGTESATGLDTALGSEAREGATHDRARKGVARVRADKVCAVDQNVARAGKAGPLVEVELARCRSPALRERLAKLAENAS